MRILYKYYSQLDFALDTITENRFYFSSPDDFNDPFDCRPRFSLLSCKNEDEEAWKLFMQILVKEENPDISDDEAVERAEAMIRRGKHKDNDWLRKSDEYSLEIQNKMLEDIRICCFTKTARNPMMWAHYANGHKGIVLQFRIDKGMFEGFDVEYYPGRISLRRYEQAMRQTLEGDDFAFAKFSYCSKSDEWAAEEEVRFFSNNYYYSYPKEMLTGILLGSRCPSHWEKILYKASSCSSSKPKIYKEDTSMSYTKICFKLVRR